VEFPELNEIFSVSDTDAIFLLQSRMSTITVTEPVVVEIGGLGYTSEYHEFGMPAAVVQFALPELLLVNVTLGL
jgi:hypothetical protein